MTDETTTRSLSTHTARALVATLGVIGMAWCTLTLPSFWNDFPLTQFATHILRGETFPVERLEQTLRVYRSGPHITQCSSTAAHNASVIELALLRSRFDDSSAPTDADFERTMKAVKYGLSCLPSDAYLWFSLFQVESLRTGLRDDYIHHLDMSYQVGPNEGWLAIPRNRAAFAIFPALPDALQSKVLDEFCLLLRSELYAEAIDIFLGAAKPYQARLIQRLEAVPVRNRQLFAVQLARKGIDAQIPGTSVVVR